MAELLLIARFLTTNSMKPLLAIVVMLTLTINGYSQMSNWEKGDDFYEKKDYKNALTYYFLALREYKSDPRLLYKIGLSYLNTEDKGQAVSFLQKAYKINPEVDPEILYQMGIAYQSSLQYVQAKYLYEQFKKVTPKKRWEEIDEKINQCIVSHGILSNPLDIIIENVGFSVNSPFDDYSPIISPDGETFYFTSNRVEDSTKIGTRTNFEDIYYSKLLENADWSAPQKIGPPISTNNHDAIASISPDGKTLFIYYGTNKGDLYTSVKNDKGVWSKPAPLKTLNTPQFRETSASISKDGKKLFFSSSRTGTKGGLDIFMSQWDPALNDWGRAVNLGDLINTAGDEDSPYIHPDGETLYFSSNGHAGMGSSDIFKSTLKDGKWQKPENMGYPINSIEYDGFFSISEDKKVAYFATMRKYGVGRYDILKATYRSVFQQQKPAIASATPATTTTPTTNTTTASATKKETDAKKTEAVAKAGEVIIKGKVTDQATAKPIPLTISLVNIRTNKLIASVQSDKATGAYEMSVKESGDFVITAESPGYLFNSLNVKVQTTSENRKIETNFVMLKPNAGSVMVLNNILFDPGKADLKPASLSELEKVRKLLVDNPNLKVRINGHTDNVGDPAFNKTLSLKRALAVVNYLALNGIAFERLGAIGYGSERPTASNDDEKGGRELNRRTEIEIIDNTEKTVAAN